MGADIHFHLLKRNESTGEFEKIALYDFENNEIPLYSGRHYEFFEWISSKGYSMSTKNLKSDIAAIIKDDMADYYYDFREISLATLKIFELEEACGKQIVDSENEELKPFIHEFIKTVFYYTRFADADFEYNELANYKLIYYFDH